MKDGSEIFATIVVIAFFAFVLFSCSYYGSKADEADEKRYQEAYDEGYELGEEKGYEAGYDEGYSVGYSEGYVAGEESTWGE